MIITLLGRSCLSQQFFEKKRLFPCNDDDDMRAFRRVLQHKAIPETMSNCSVLKQTKQNCAHLLGALGPKLSLPVFMTKHVINESVSIDTFHLPLGQGYHHYSCVFIASSSHTLHGRIEVPPCLSLHGQPKKSNEE